MSRGGMSAFTESNRDLSFVIFTKNKEGVRAIGAIEYKKSVAGKYTRARARKCTNRIFESKK